MLNLPVIVLGCGKDESLPDMSASAPLIASPNPPFHRRRPEAPNPPPGRSNPE